MDSQLTDLRACSERAAILVELWHRSDFENSGTDKTLDLVDQAACIVACTSAGMLLKLYNLMPLYLPPSDSMPLLFYHHHSLE